MTDDYMRVAARLLASVHCAWQGGPDPAPASGRRIVSYKLRKPFDLGTITMGFCSLSRKCRTHLVGNSEMRFYSNSNLTHGVNLVTSPSGQQQHPACVCHSKKSSATRLIFMQ
jgi:hypothetical protein